MLKEDLSIDTILTYVSFRRTVPLMKAFSPVKVQYI